MTADAPADAPAARARGKRKPPTSVAVAVVVALAVLAGGWAIRPAPPRLEQPGTGDRALLAAVHERHGGVGNRLAVAMVDLTDPASPVRFAGHGADEHSRFEIGSVTKGLTGLLLADAVRRGEVRLDQPLGDLLPLDGSAAAAVTLEELATHHSGLPRVATQPAAVARSALANLRGDNPYPYSVDDVLAHARAAGTDDRGRPGYSNLGAALLGQALAEAAGTSYRQLLTERLFTPLGMTRSQLPADGASAAAAGYGAGGRPAAPWVMEGYAPAGGVVSTPADLALLARALLGGAGSEALAARRDFDQEEARIGLHWISTPLPGTDRTMVWHNGGTGGYRSFLGLDLERKRAVVVLSDVAADVDGFATELLAEEP